MDIIFFAAIALFIFIKLREQLGKISEAEKGKIAEKIKTRQERILRLQNKISEQINNSSPNDFSQSVKENPALKNTNSKTKKALESILKRTNTSFEFFIEGAKSAFEMVLKAFAEKDKETLQFLLTEKIYSGFEKSIEDRKSENKKLNTNLISIEKTEVMSASIQEDIAFVTVKLNSKQINYFTNEEGEIVEGKKENIQDLSDIWTFKKDLNDKNPNWKISATG